MPLRIAFDLDGVPADMESELVRQAEVLFGEPMTRRLQERASKSGAATPASAAAKRLGIGVVKSVAECLDILTQVDSAEAREQPQGSGMDGRHVAPVLRSGRGQES